MGSGSWRLHRAPLLSAKLRAKIHTGSLKLNNRMEKWFLLCCSDSRVNMWCSVPACMCCSDCWWWRCLHHNRPISLSVSSLASFVNKTLTYLNSSTLPAWAEHVVSYCVHRVCDTELHVSCVQALWILCVCRYFSVLCWQQNVCHSFHVGLVHTVQK